MTQYKEYIIFTCIWLLIGLLSTIFMWICDMRGKEYNEKYFDEEIVWNVIPIFMGGFTLILIIFILLQEQYNKRKKNRRFTKFIYKLANIGVNKKESDNE